MSQLVINGHIIDAPMKLILSTIKKELRNGKLSSIEDKGDNFRVTCPSHKGGHEQNSSCQIYCGNSSDVEYGYMFCFTCGERGPLYHFVAECFDETDEFGKQWLLDRFGNTLVDRADYVPEFKLDSKEKVEYLDESLLDEFEDYHPYMDKRRLTPEVCKFLKIKYDPKTECLVFPVYDEYNKLYMLTRRSVNSKQFIIDKNKDKPIYLFNIIKSKGLKEVTVVESQINAATLWTYGIPAVATFGCNISEHQFELFNRSGIMHYYICFDGDEAGVKGTKKFIRNINKDAMIDVIIMPEGKDVNDLTEEEFDKLPIVEYHDWLKVY